MSKPAPNLTIERLYDLLQRSQLLNPVELLSIGTRLREGGAARSDLARSAHWLIDEGFLTRYQFAMLLHGHFDNLRLGPYRLLDRIGKGNLAAVYKAANPKGETVALKVLLPTRARDPRWLIRFQNDAQVACQLRHPNIVRAFETGEASGVHFLVLEYLQGENLAELLKHRGSLAPDEIVHLAKQTLSGMQYLFEQGFMHRNLDPSNLMLPYPTPSECNVLEATIKILDTSMSRSLFEEALAPEGAGRLTHAGEFVGSPEYLAPEQAHDPRTCDIRADLYSLGCILYQVAAGTPPFQDSSPFRLVIRHATEWARPLGEIRPDLPACLVTTIERLLRKDPDERFPDPASAAQALGASEPQEAEGLIPRMESSESEGEERTADSAAEPGVFIELAAASAAAPPVDFAVAADPAALFSLPQTSEVSHAKPPPESRLFLHLFLGAAGLVAVQILGWALAHLVAALRAKG